MITISSILKTCALAKLRLLDNLYLPLSSPLGDLKIFREQGGKVIMLNGKRDNFGFFLREQVLSGNYQQTPDVKEQNCKSFMPL